MVALQRGRVAHIGMQLFVGLQLLRLAPGVLLLFAFLFQGWPHGLLTPWRGPSTKTNSLARGLTAACVGFMTAAEQTSMQLRACVNCCLGQATAV